ncbi:hypothetical protein HOP50_13g69100 [Chloropicon primus]|nr:hypothetical protein HOP50_13g69100 [Chloropicon primus]
MASRVVCSSSAVASRRATDGGIRSRIATSRRRASVCRRVLEKPSDEGSAVLDEEEIVDELKQMKQEKLERAGKYRAKVAGTETPEWNYARVVENREVFPKLRELVLEVETSRELVSLRNSYCAVGKLCQLKVKGSEPVALVPSCAPFPAEDQHAALLKLRGDLRAGQTKLPEEPLNVKARLSVLVSPDDGAEVYDLGPEAEDSDPDSLAVEVGPFLGSGLSFRGPIQSVYNYSTILICAEGKGVGTARAMIETSMGRGSLDLTYREDVRLYYKVANEDSVCYEALFESWEKEYGVKTIVHTSSFLDAFDDDDTLEYEPETTAVISLGGEEADKMAEELCEEAEIRLHVKSTQEQDDMHYADTGRVV